MVETVDVLSDTSIRCIDKKVLQQNYCAKVDSKPETTSLPNLSVTGRLFSENQNNNYYITMFKELGGGSTVYSPGGSMHPVAFVNKLGYRNVVV